MTTDLRAYAREAAARNGIDGTNFERQIDQESGFNPAAHNNASGADGLAQIVVRWHPAMAGKTGDPYASLDYAAGLMRNHLAVYDGDWALALSAYNAGPGATAQGLAGKLDGWPYAETVRYVANILRIPPMEAAKRLIGAKPMTVTFNADEPPHPQENSYDCSQDSLEWALWALGRRPDNGWMEATMIAERVMSAADGLLDASGAGLAAFVRRQYGEFGFDANNENPISFDALAAEIGPYPMLIGGRAWGHWSGLRGYDPQRDVLLLANPAENYKGVGQTLSREQFNVLGPFSMVRVLHPDLLTQAPPAPTPAPDPLAAIRARLRAMSAELESIAAALP